MKSEQQENMMLYSNMKSIISLVDKLRDFKLDNYISLPRITVLGEQSAGKSSILEGICGMNFLPRGSGVVTRRPMELRLRRTNVQVPYFIFTRDFPGKKITSETEVCKTIEILTDKVAGVDKFISSEPIVLELFSSSVPDLTVVDLPGITRIPVGKQPANIEEITKGLIRQYCDSPDSLILCVIPANIDVTTSDALMFSRQLDPMGTRTLGVLTKIDLMDEGVDCKKVLLNQEIRLHHGFIGIKGRNQREVNEKKSVKEAIQAELNYFCRHPVYSTLPSDCLGTSSLVSRTSKILYEMIKTALPRIQKEIAEKKKKAREVLDNLGENFPDSDEKKMELVFKLVRTFKELFDQEITGKFFFDDSQSLRSKVQKKKGETITFQLNRIFSELYEEMAVKDFRATEEYTNAYIQNAIDTYQGDSMPGFQSFDSFLFLITPKLRMLKSPIYEVLDEAKNILETKGNELLEDILKKYPKLLGEVRETFIKEVSKTKMNTQKILDNIVRCEENYLFTNNPEILGTISAKQIKKNMTTKDLLVVELRNRIDCYFNIVVKNIRNTVPKIVGQFLLQKLRENLEVEILNALAKRNYCLDGFAESDTSSSLRKKTKEELQSLTAAENLLINEFGMTFELAKNISNEQSYERKFDSKEVDAELIEDIDRMNDDFLNFNIGLLKLSGENPKVMPRIQERPNTMANTRLENLNRPVDRTREDLLSQKNSPQMSNNQQNLNNGGPSAMAYKPSNVTTDKKPDPIPQPSVNTKQNVNPQQIPNQQNPQNPNTFQNQPRPAQPQPTVQTNNWPNTQPAQNQPPKQVQPNPYDVSLVGNAPQNQPRVNNPNPQKLNTVDPNPPNSFLNFGNDRNKSPIKPPQGQGQGQPQSTFMNPQMNTGQTSQPVTQPTPQNNQQKPGLNLQKPEEVKPKPVGKFGNLFG